MGQSIISKPPKSRRVILTQSGSTATDSGIIKLELPKNSLVSEHVLDIAISQTWGTNPPSSSDVRRTFTKVELVSDVLGTIMSCDFHQLYDQARFHENSPVPVVAYGAGSGAAATARFPVDIHHVMHSATLDLLTAMQTSEHGSLYVQLTLAAKADGPFIGGTGTAGEITAAISVKEHAYRALSGRNVRSGKFAYGRAHHELKALAANTGASAAVQDLQAKLTGGRKLRELYIHTYDTATAAIAALANGILDKITSLEIGGVEYCQNVLAEELQHENIADANYNQTGVYVLSFGDDPAGWPFIGKGEEVILKFTKRTGSVAGWKITVAQDSAVNLDRSIVA